MPKKKHKKKDNIYICEYCNSEHDGSYGSGRFCSAGCSSRYSNTFVSEKGRKNQIATLTNPEVREKRRYNYDLLKETIIPKKKKELKTISAVRIGKIGEFKVAAKFAQRDIPVYLPMTEAEEADMIAEFGGKLQKVQVKTSNQLTGKYEDSMRFKLTNVHNKVSHGKIYSSAKVYDTKNVDYFALYSLPSDKIYLVKNDGIKTSMQIRDKYPANGQKTNINLASDYDIDNVLDLIENGIDPDNVINCDYKIENE